MAMFHHGKTKHGAMKNHHQGPGGHTGRIRHDDMHTLLDGDGSKDPHAHSSHHSMNKEHGTPQGLSVEGDYDEGSDGCGGAMGENCEYT